MDELLRMGEMTGEQTEKVLQFQELTGIEDLSVCREVLQRHSWDIEVAVQDQLNIREGRPSVFATNARPPMVVNDQLTQHYFFARPEHNNGGGFTGLFRYVFNLIFSIGLNTLTSILNFTFRLFRPDPRRLLTDPLGDVRSFITNFETQYGSIHPVFYQGTYSHALNDAKQELKFLLVFLHNENNADSVDFCRNTLTNLDLVTYINQQMLFWACSVHTGEGYRVSQALRENTYPFLVMIVLKDGRMNIVARMEGAVGPEELQNRLVTVVLENEVSIIAARADRMERSFNQSLRAQQDEAYQLSLLADQEKERLKCVERQRVQEEVEAKLRLEEEEKQRKEEVKKQKFILSNSIPEEPPSNDPSSVQLIIKLPCGSRLERRFSKNHTLQDVYHFVFSHPAAPDSFEIATNFPKRVLDCYGTTQTLEEAGIKRGEVLFVYDLEA